MKTYEKEGNELQAVFRRFNYVLFSTKIYLVSHIDYFLYYHLKLSFNV